MLTNKKIIGFLAAAIILLLTGCYKDKTVIFTTGAEVTRQVSFANDIIPIFAKSCSISGCHVTGGQVPDLTATNAYNSLTNGNYYDKSNPTNSTIYKKMTGKMGTVMPVGGMNPDYNALILAWIKQGANNN